MDIRLIAEGICTRCGSVTLYDAERGININVPDFKWLNDRGYIYKVSDDFMYHFVSCNSCVNHYRVDYCSCGSGKHYEECECGSKEPYYFLNDPEYYL